MATILRRLAGRQPETITPRDTRRRLLSGQTAPAAQTGATWQSLVAPGPAPTGGARANPHHPSRKHDIERPAPTYLVTHDPQPDRRTRRALARAEARKLQRSRRATTRDELAFHAQGMPSRSVMRWANRLYATTPDSPLLAALRALHDKALTALLARRASRKAGQ